MQPKDFSLSSNHRYLSYSSPVAQGDKFSAKHRRERMQDCVNMVLNHSELTDYYKFISHSITADWEYKKMIEKKLPNFDTLS